jgi:YfiH family protein
MHADWLTPDWPAPAWVRACQTTRAGGASLAPYSGFNLGDHVGDDPVQVAAHRQWLAGQLPAAPLWLQQVHGTTVVRCGEANVGIEADAAVAMAPGQVCAVMTADCLPVLLCDRAGSRVAAAHAGWRGLCAGVLEQTVAALAVPGETLLAWLGPAIGPTAFEVGDEVRQAFLDQDSAAASAFRAAAPGKWWADLYQLARQRLAGSGVHAVYGGDCCTFGDPERFYSYRRDGRTGRMASLIWLQKPGSV